MSSNYDCAYEERNVNVDAIDSIDFTSLNGTRSATAERREKRDSRAKPELWQHLGYACPFLFWQLRVTLAQLSPPFASPQGRSGT